jgi:hypothetical protein
LNKCEILRKLFEDFSTNNTSTILAENKLKKKIPFLLGSSEKNRLS